MKQIIGYSIDKNSGIYCSTGEKQTETPYLNFLLNEYPDSIKIFSDLDSDVAQLFKLIGLTSRELDKLATTNRLIIPPYDILYIPKKWFSIDKDRFKASHKYAGFSDTNQYNDIAMSYTPEGKATLAQQIGTEVYKAFTELGFDPNNLISPANVYRKEKLDNIDLPKFDDIPQEAMEIAYECCKGNWLEAFAIGHWDKVYDYDITSAYPYQASRLLDTRLGKWKQSIDYQNDATYGYCRCEIMIDKEFSPIIKQYGDRNYTPKGIFETSLTKGEIDFINKWDLGYATILDGWWWFKDAIRSEYPLLREIENLYKEKEQAIGIKREIIKRIMSGSFYGLFIELKGDNFGDHFFAPYAAEIESRNRLAIADICMKNEITPLHIAVDGFITNKYIALPDDKSLGSLRMENKGKALICSSGLTAIESKVGKGDFSVSYDYIMKQIDQDNMATFYEMKKKEVLTLAQAKNLGRIEDVGSVETITKTVEFGDNKREYETQPSNFGELANGQYLSTAWDNKMIEALEEVEKVELWE